MSASDLWLPGDPTDPAGARATSDRRTVERLSSFSAVLGERNSVPDHDPAIHEMRKNRAINRRVASVVGGGGGNISQTGLSFATGRPRDPMFYWKQNNLPFDVTKEDELQKVRAYCRLLYLTHPIIASAIDIYSKYPLTGMEFSCKDDALVDFYTTLFFEQMNYEEYLVDVLREFWLVGEAWPMGSFNETLGVWEDDELLNPDDIKVERSPFLREPRFKMKLPETIRAIMDTRQPVQDFVALQKAYPELWHFQGNNEYMPVSNILLKQLKFKGDSFHPRGLPILMRGFRSIFQEEMLNAAMDAVASRLYTPLLLVKLGASATDLGTNAPWIPTEGDLMNFEEALDAALAADFRVITHHFAVQMESVFGREAVPDLNQDFERLEDKELQIFGLSRTMLNGADNGQTYAADALNRDIVSQLLGMAQRMIKRFTRDRMLVVAEAQEHFDYEERNGKRYPIMEEVLEIDEETGEARIVEQPKLLVPDLKIKAMSMANEEARRQFLEALRASGVPISEKTRAQNIDIDLGEERELTKDEQVEAAVMAQEVRKETYLALRDKGLPIPEDLQADFQPKAIGSGSNPVDPDLEAQEPARPALLGVDGPAPTLALVPTPDDMAIPPSPTPGQEEGRGVDVSPQPVDPAVQKGILPLPRNKLLEEQGGGPLVQKGRPPESDEQRRSMPKPASFKKQSFLKDAEGQPVKGNDGKDVIFETEVVEGPNRLITGPRHIGMRRYANVQRGVPFPDEDEEAS